jgi:hypothetical protein
MFRYSAMLVGGWGTVGGVAPRLLAGLLPLLLPLPASSQDGAGAGAPAPSDLLPHLLDGQAREPKIDSELFFLRTVHYTKPIDFLLILSYLKLKLSAHRSRKYDNVVARQR